jgi:hypothetical protein
MTPDAPTAERTLTEVKRAYGGLMEEIRAWVDDHRPEPAQLSERAVDALGRFASELSRMLLDATALKPDAEADAWVKRKYDEWLDQAGAEMRDVLGDSMTRHGIAQALQGKMFEADAALRSALRLRKRVQPCPDLA